MASGFRDFTLIEAEPAFAKLRQDPEFAAVVADLRRLGDVQDVLTVDRPPVLRDTGSALGAGRRLERVHRN